MPTLTKVWFCAAVIFIAFSNPSLAQVFAPDRNWVGQTQYLSSNNQDSVFIFFPGVDMTLRAQFSDSSAATYQWFRYNENLPVSQRFQPISGATDSLLSLTLRGGYRVEVKRIADDSTQIYTAWVMRDNVEIVSLNVQNNSCSLLELVLSTQPNFFDVFTLFTYNDLSTQTHQERSILGAGGYFANHLFESLNTQVEVSPTAFGLPFIFVEFENEFNGKSHGPLYNSEYKFTVTTPFGRGVLSAQTPTIPAISTKVGFDIYFNLGDDLLPDWQKQTDDFPKEEALLEMKLESTAENADSIFWNIINDELLFQRGRDSILWSDKSLFSERFESYPPKEKMVPGIYGVEHIALKRTNGIVCRDTLLRTVEVDTSFINSASIPNVFTPNGDGINDYFVLKDVETSITSIRDFKITILSRWGKQVYVYTGDPKTWEGWNGKIDGTKGDAAEGVYFYVIEAVGWDGRRYRGGAYKGFLHLYR